MIGCGRCGMSEQTHTNGRFLFVHKGSVVDAIFVDCEEGRLMASLGVVRWKWGLGWLEVRCVSVGRKMTFVPLHSQRRFQSGTCERA